MACAYQLNKLGIQDVLIIEASEEVGGLSKSIDFKGSQVDIGPHRFLTQHHSVFQFFKDVLGKDLLTIQRKTRIHFKGSLIRYPLALGNIVKTLGLGSGIKILKSFIAGRFKKYSNNFEGALKSRFGDYLFDLFFKDYSEKLWGLPVNEIDASWAEQRIQGFSLTKAIASTVFKSKDATSSDFFYYPRFGAGYFYQKLKKLLVSNQVEFKLGSRVEKLLPRPHDSIMELVTDQGETFIADHVVSTMPLNLLLRALPNINPSVLSIAGKLRFRSTVFVYVQLDNANLSDDHWIYLQMPDVRSGRLTNFNNWSPEQLADNSKTHLCLEYWTNEGDALFNLDSPSLEAMAQEDLKRLGFLTTASVVSSKVLKVPKTYPVYYKGYQKDIDVLKQGLNSIGNLHPIGRYGSYKYNNQDHSLLMGMLAAQKISGDNIDLWRVDHNTYIEKGNIHETVS